MKNFIWSFIFIVATLTGCSGQQVQNNASDDRVNVEKPTLPIVPKIEKYIPAIIPFAGGDVCDHAKTVLLQRTQEYETMQSFANHLNCSESNDSDWRHCLNEQAAAKAMLTARANVLLLCKDNDKGGTWACAEGHSCR